jgi:drug/metabolite transporter (DMT)-like permease
LLVVGGSFLFAAATILTRREIGVLASLLAGLILIGFKGVEVALIDRDTATLPTALPQQILMAALGLFCVGLAAFIWRGVYRGQGLLDHHASPA